MSKSAHEAVRGKTESVSLGRKERARARSSVPSTFRLELARRDPPGAITAPALTHSPTLSSFSYGYLPATAVFTQEISQMFLANQSMLTWRSDMAAGGRTPKQRRFDIDAGMATLRNVVNSPRRRRGSCKCLFGAPDREETRRLMSEQYARERKRFIRRFNFDVESECAYKAAKLDSPVKFCEDDKENSQSPVRTATEALACVVNTDLRMLGSPSRRSTSSSPRTPRTPRTPRAARTPRTPRTPASRRQLQMTG